MPVTLSTVYTASVAVLPVVFLTYLAKRRSQNQISKTIKMSKKRTVVVVGGGVAGTDGTYSVYFDVKFYSDFHLQWSVPFSQVPMWPT